MPDRPPNFLIVFMDDMGWGDMGCFGSDTAIRTPHMDAVAARGAQLTQMYSAAPICTPSRAALLTGRYAQRMGLSRVLFPRDTVGLVSRDRTVAAMLRDAGYATCAIGKWHVGCLPKHYPTRHGFDHFFGLPYSNDMSPLPLLRGEETVEEAADQASLTRRYTDEAIRFIAEHRDEPFLVYLAHTMPHIPLHVEEQWRGRSAGGLYGDTIECIDWHLGRLLDRLGELELTQETLVVVTSDNGPWFEGSAGPFRGRKFDVYEGGVREPFVAQWPGRIPAGHVCDGPASLMDLMPTMAALAGAEMPADRVIDGLDISAALFGGPVPEREAFYYYLHDTLQAVRVGRWKLHVAFGFDDKTHEMPQLFDMEADPGENYNLARNHPDVVERLQGMIETFDAEVKADLAARPAP